MPQRDEEAPVRRSELNRGRLEALASSLVALLALLMSAYTVYVQREQLKAQVWPRLALVENNTGTWPELHYTWSLKNRGTAPAEIRSMRLTVGSDEAENWLDWLRLMRKQQGDLKESRNVATAYSPVDDVLGAGDEVTLFETSSASILALMTADQNSAVAICYCSMLNDCWEYTENAASVKATSPVPNCPAPKKKFRGWPEEMKEESVKALRTLVLSKTVSIDAGSDAAIIAN
jgi:hypothetical protein